MPTDRSSDELPSSAPDDEERDAMRAVLARAETDANFRQQLLVEPRRIIYETFGIRIPEQFRIRFIERERDVDALVVLPDLRASANELTDQDLEHVTGGAHASNAHNAWKGAKPKSPTRHLI